MTIQHVVFDIGNTLIEGLPGAHLFQPDSRSRRAEALSQRGVHPDWHLEQDRGRSWEEAGAVLIAKYPEEADLIRAYRANFWNDLVIGDMETLPAAAVCAAMAVRPVRSQKLSDALTGMEEDVVEPGAGSMPLSLAVSVGD